MKKLYLHISFFLVLFTNYNFAQTEKGTKFYGGFASISYFADLDDFDFDKTPFITINPDYGKFVLNNFAIGLNAILGKIDYSPFFTFGPFAKLYLGTSKRGKFFGQISATLGFSDGITIDYGLKVGYVLFIYKTMTIEFAGTFSKVKQFSDFEYGYIGPGASLGFHKHLK